jgi:hypothetical protein
MVAEISLIRSQASEASEQRVLVQCMSTGYCTRTLTDVTSTPLQQEQTLILFPHTSDRIW